MAHLTYQQRYTISVLLTARKTKSFIAGVIGKHPSVVGREIARNSDGRSGSYSADLAQRKYGKRIKEKPKKIWFTPEIAERVEAYLSDDYSPEQIAGVCRNERLPCVSPERIYQHIWQDKKAGGNLFTHLRRNGRMYRKRGNKKDSRGIIVGRVGIEQRPAIVDLKERFGNLEVDTIIGKNHKGAIVTINDRASGMLKMKKVASKHASHVKDAIVEGLNEWKPFLKTLTSDNGKEFAGHQKIAQRLQLDFYFARPYHSWERGANENLNGLIRQYIPKKTDFATVSDDYVKWIENKLNTRPRKRHAFKSPTFVMNKLLSNQKIAFVT